LSLASLVPKQRLRPRGITSQEKMARDYELRSRGPTVRGLSTLDSTYFSNLESFQVHYPDFQLDDKFLVEGGDVMWGEIY
jgi:hypothetical protein